MKRVLVVCSLTVCLCGMVVGCNTKPGAEIPANTVAFDPASTKENLVGPGMGKGGASKGKATGTAPK